MIYQIKANCKDYSELILKNFHGGQASAGEYRCSNPNCRCGLFYRHGTYERHVYHFEPDSEPGDLVVFKLPDGNVCIDSIMQILRVKCAGCGTTHSIVPTDMIPFQAFSLTAFLTLVCHLLSTNTPATPNHTVIHAVDGLSWHMQKRILQIYLNHHNRMMAALRQQGLYEACGDIQDPVLAKVYLGLSPPPDAPLAFLRCHKRPVFLNRRSTVSYPLRFLLPAAL